MSKTLSKCLQWEKPLRINSHSYSYPISLSATDNNLNICKSYIFHFKTICIFSMLTGILGIGMNTLFIPKRIVIEREMLIKICIECHQQKLFWNSTVTFLLMPYWCFLGYTLSRKYISKCYIYLTFTHIGCVYYM